MGFRWWYTRYACVRNDNYERHQVSNLNGMLAFGSSLYHAPTVHPRQPSISATMEKDQRIDTSASSSIILHCNHPFEDVLSLTS